MTEEAQTTVRLKQILLKKLHKYKPHPRCTHGDTIEMLIDSYEKKQVKSHGEKK